ncbi:AAA family ATPase [Leptolyngbya sp. FACHB-261]|uniref:AAA family ATPase n=1 Tax=Leptolyngbya sp. FACHB-261 TaxID=2692806 RepID=UPI0016863605|nr:AAA family ATPase [Leptolyngbya sp. FACHB-261]MBD2104451.1 AAA family ATPase [Leptolyngbya sp. FACHB-261]
MSTARFCEELDLLIRSRHPLIYVVTVEEERTERAIQQVAAAHQPPRQVQLHDLVRGFEHNQQCKDSLLRALLLVEQAPAWTPTLFVFRDLHRMVGPLRSDPQVIRQLKHLYRSLRNSAKTIILLSPALELASELEEYLAVMEFPLLEPQEIRLLIRKRLGARAVQLTPSALDQLVKACSGLTCDRISHLLARSVTQDSALTDAVIDRVLAEKKQRIRRTEILEFFTPTETLDRIGGLDNLKTWVLQRRRAFSEEARRFGLPHPKGLLLAGIQGTGKSLCAKAIAHLFQLPLLRLDVGRLFDGSLVGRSESRTRQMIQLAEATAPCVLWIDELDKAFAGMSGAAGDSGTSARVFATLVTWMQERDSAVFLVATANNIDSLPPELLRKGRFDEIFFINLPSYAERRAIFRVHLERFRPDNLGKFEVDRLAELTPEYSGAEIEQAVVEGMYRAFHQGRDLTTEDIVQAIHETVPLSHTAREQINYLKEWAAQGRARSASTDVRKLAEFDLDSRSLPGL